MIPTKVGVTGANHSSAGHASEDRFRSTIEHVHRQRQIRNEYAYWEDGKLRFARYESESDAAVFEHFDREGRPIDKN